MGIPRQPNPVKLFIGMIAREAAWFQGAIQSLQERYGPVDFESHPRPWDYTQYYTRELGSPLFRKFIFFEGLIPPQDLWNIKMSTNEIEKRLGETSDEALYRRVNLDPGYLTQSKVVLATTKDFAHRIYLQEGIYAEVTLIYQGKGFQTLPYTYPDYKAKETLELFHLARELYRRQLQSLP